MSIDKERIGFEIKMNEDERIVEIPTSPELKEHFKKQSEKNYIYYLKEFLGSEKNFKKADNAFIDSMKRSLPEDRKDRCKYCLKKSDHEGDRLCEKYYLQMRFTFYMAANEFVSIVLNNKFIYNNKTITQQLTIKFFDCLYFIKGKGVMYFNLDKICRYALEAGFLSISQEFSKSETLTNLKIINENLHELEQQEVLNKTLKEKDENYLELQKEFFETKQRYYKEKLTLDREETKSEAINPELNSKKKTLSIPKTVLYYYYLQATGYFPYFENHNSGKIGGIKSLIKEDCIETTPKYFQIAYNKIANHSTNRIAKNQESNISYVANQMLNNYPKAKELALSELKQAQLKNR